MITLIMGGSGSGKSAYAEKYLQTVSEGEKKYYLATMQIFDEEGRRKVEKHRKLRQGKGFSTIEQPTSISEALQKMEAGEKAALLECMSNLTANEMFQTDPPKAKESVVGKILQEIITLHQELTHLVIVTNNVFEDGIFYDKATMEYIQALGEVNQSLADMAEEVVELVVGIPVILKKGNAK